MREMQEKQADRQAEIDENKAIQAALEKDKLAL